MIDHLDIKLRLFIVASPFCLGLTALAMDFHIAISQQYKQMVTALHRSPCLSYAITLWGEKGIRSRMLVIFMVAGAITFPISSIRRGLLDKEDYEQLPKPLKTKIVIASWLSTTGFTWLVINYFII
ncbi:MULTISPECIES: hypothetical protein [Pseudomonas]|jgi:hypothetical protein|uniref:hypothetical protein n=1 Tax=Pseudomonas TaxID=286 RepID=UPI0009EDF98F|nr:MULTISPECIES: hypothetical protein [Pseudomonas]MBA6111433.1 hypothetical protein [Pseudomonas asiatica]